MRNIYKVALGAAALGLVASAASAATLDDVKARGVLKCAVNTGLAGFASPDDKGEYSGFDVDYCKALAAAIFGDVTKVEYTPTSAKDRFEVLANKTVDVLVRNSTWTLSRDTTLGFNFTGVNYYDGQGFMINAKKLPGITSALQLSGASVCVQTGTTTELNLADYFKANNLEYNPVVFEKLEEVNAAYDSGRCDVYTTDQSGLYAIRLSLSAPADHVVLPEIISKEPLGPVVRHGDDQWFDIVKWVRERARHHRGTGRDPGQCRGNEGLGQSRDQARSRPGRKRQVRCRPWSRRGLGCQRRQGRRQLWRSVRAQHRLGQPAQDRPWPECPVVEGWTAIRPADPLIV